MKLSGISFYRLLLGIGVLIVSGVAFHMVYRGLEMYPMGPVWEVRSGRAEQGEELISRYGCGSCHVIPGIRKATGRVGPQLRDLENQVYIGGVLPNTPENLVAWIQDPKRFSTRTAMPDLNVSEEDARHIAAYLLQSFDPPKAARTGQAGR